MFFSSRFDFINTMSYGGGRTAQKKQDNTKFDHVWTLNPGWFGTIMFAICAIQCCFLMVAFLWCRWTCLILMSMWSMWSIYMFPCVFFFPLQSVCKPHDRAMAFSSRCQGTWPTVKTKHLVIINAYGKQKEPNVQWSRYGNKETPWDAEIE